MKTVRERLHARLVPCADEGCRCRLWTGCLNSRGYGVISVNGERKLVHRVAWELDNDRPVPEGLTIDHVRDRGCVHKNCAEVAHLEPVTVAENIRRSAPQRAGKPHPHRIRKEHGLDDEFWRGFAEWAGPEEWADLATTQLNSGTAPRPAVPRAVPEQQPRGEYQVTDEQVRDLLAAIREALDAPWPPKGEDGGQHDRLIAGRAAFIRGVLRHEVEGTVPLDLETDARIIRDFAAQPLPYVPQQPEGGE